MRLVCLHADTVDALKRLKIQFDDLTPAGLWSSQYHLVGLTPDQFDALEVFHVQAEDITPAQLAQTGIEPPKPAAGESAASEKGAAAPRPAPADRPETLAPSAETAGREPVRGGGTTESEVPLAQARDGDARGGEVRAETKTETKPDGKTTTQTSPQAGAQNPGAQAAGGQQGSGQQGSGQKGAKGGPQVAPPAQGNRKGQAAQGQGGGQRYGTTRLRISVAGKYTEATVANGKIVVAGRSFDTPDQAAAELTKSRGDWTFWEYYDSTDGKWRMLTRDWDTVLKSAAPGGR
jgi:hypothetical protein